VKPFDPRLTRHAAAARSNLALAAIISIASAALLVVQAFAVAELVVRPFQQDAPPAALTAPLIVLGCVVGARAALVWASEAAAHRASAQVMSQLRRQLLAHVIRLGPAWLARNRVGELTVLATRGIDALDGYFARYLPALVTAAVVPPAVVVVVASQDLLSAAIILATLPLIPLFAALVGLATERRTRRRWRTFAALGGHFLDVVDGLPTLLVFRRAAAQVDTIRRVTDDYRRATMRTLRLAFLSSAVLEFVATISVALVAVSSGLRLVNGSLDLRTGLVMIMLAPEAYWPLRQVGAQFHASADGLAAAGQVLDVLETRSRPACSPRQQPPDLARTTIRIEALTVAYDRNGSALGPLDLTIHPGEYVGVAGRSGCGKSTLLGVLLGFVTPTSGRVLLDHETGVIDLAEVDLDAWRSQLAWLPQDPWFAHGTVADNVRLARPAADDGDVVQALRLAHAFDFVSLLPGGLSTVIGEDGLGLSAGQRQRLALARAFLRDSPMVLLDEATAHLDPNSETVVASAIRRLSTKRTLLVAAHRPALLRDADRVVLLDDVSEARFPALVTESFG
jgi:thiol reductant ABC exporter CydD subunit